MTALMTEHAVDTTSPRVLRVLGEADLDDASRLLAAGFEDDPSSITFIPDARQRLRLNQLSSRRAVRAALPHASVYGIEIDRDLAGVAIWHPPGVAAASLAATLQYVAGLARELPHLGSAASHMVGVLLGDQRAAFQLAMHRRDAVREASSGPTWHLAFLATDAAYRGQGVGRQLIDHVLHRCDADGLPAWLETTNPVNPPIYERFGFETIAQIDGGRSLPTWWVMRRHPAPPER